MADALADQAWQDWCDALADLFVVDALAPFGLPQREAVEPDAWPMLDGAVQLHVPWLGCELRLAVGADAVTRWMATGEVEPDSLGRFDTPRLVPLLKAIDSRPVPLRVELGRVDVDLGTLAALRIGDVFCTGHALEAPLPVYASASADWSTSVPVCTAHLGARGEWRAIEFQRGPSCS